MRFTLCLLLLLALAAAAFAQLPNVPGDVLFRNAKMVNTDSGMVLQVTATAGCKNFPVENFPVNNPLPPEVIAIKKPVMMVPATKLFTIHGNISYEYFYRSKIDTPFNQNDLQQHTERVNLQISVKDKYPLRISFASRQSNSPFFRNFFDGNFQFDRFAFNKNLKKKLYDQIAAKAMQKPDLKNIEAALEAEKAKLQRLKGMVSDPGILQKIVEARERAWLLKTSSAQKAAEDSAKNVAAGGIAKQKQKLLANPAVQKADSAVAALKAAYEEKQEELKKAGQAVQALQNKADSIKVAGQKDLALVRQAIYKATDQKELLKIASENGIVQDSRKELDEKLSFIKTFSIGKSVLNYTELTAQNITITGINVEYNPGYYMAFAAGKVDYRFRDFFNKNSKSNGQYISLGRFGVGNKDKRAVIFTLFKGRKNQSEYAIADSFKNHVDILGYSVETIYKKDDNTFLSAEFAKSTKPFISSAETSKQPGVLWKLQDRTNMGINLKGQTIIPETDTKLSGFFRKTGQNFQSFSLFSYNTDQTAWLAKIDQSLWKKKVTVTAMLRRNDFTNPFTEKTFKTSTVFKSLLVNVRVPKYPTLSVGYYPGTQYYIIDKETIRENAYYILNGSLAYTYKVRRLAMNSALVYNRYTNKASDSGFISYKGVNYYAAQTFFLKRLQLQGAYSYTKQPELGYYTGEASADYSFKKIFKLGAGLKYNKVFYGNAYIGQRLMVGCDLNALGNFRFQYEKMYLPAVNQSLYPVETGRISWYKTF